MSNLIKIEVSAPMCGACENSELFSTSKLKCKISETLKNKDDFCLADYKPEVPQEYTIVVDKCKRTDTGNDIKFLRHWWF
jgi:hypothetical protein